MAKTLGGILVPVNTVSDISHEIVRLKGRVFQR